MDTNDIIGRVELLERSLSRMRLTVGLLSTALLTLALTAAVRHQDDTIRARRFEVVNSLGHVSAVLGENEAYRTGLYLGLQTDSFHVEVTSFGVEAVSGRQRGSLRPSYLSLFSPDRRIDLDSNKLTLEIIDLAGSVSPALQAGTDFLQLLQVGEGARVVWRVP